MTCCGTAETPDVERNLEDATSGEYRLASRPLGNGRAQLALSIPAMHCGACIKVVEDRLKANGIVRDARANLTARRVLIEWDEAGKDADLARAVRSLREVGYPAHLETGTDDATDPELNRLIRSLAVAGMAAMNIMLLSVSVWSGAEGATRDLFHWISAAIAGPAIAYAGMPFFKPALQGLRSGSLNMNVPISLGVLFAYMMSVYETARSAETAWFDAPVMLLFFLLAGRTADHLMRSRAARDITSLGRMVAKGAIVVGADGSRDYRPVEDIQPGDIVLVPAGERVPVDGVLTAARADVDRSIVNGEAETVQLFEGAPIEAGVLNVAGPITIRCTRDSRNSFIAEMQNLIESGAASRGKHRQIADRASALYAPVVHLASLGTFIAWVWFTGDWHKAAYAATSTLIVTCPCALALAVPMVHAVAAGRLSRQGILVKDGTALEHLADVDHAVFDKTGTLTLDRPEIRTMQVSGALAEAVARELARASNHPYSRGIAEALGSGLDHPADAMLASISEFAGHGVEAHDAWGAVWRLGSPAWAAEDTRSVSDAQVLLTRDDRIEGEFRFAEVLRPGAVEMIEDLKAMGLATSIATGDRADRARAIAQSLDVSDLKAGLRPGEKMALIERLRADGSRVLMIGDGLNDAPALAAATVSMTPAHASDIGRQASGIVFLGEDLRAITETITTARRMKRLVFENFGIAIAYNIVAVPLAMAGLASPLMAAIVMSLSSIAVVANASRLMYGGKARQDGPSRIVSSPAASASMKWKHA